MSEKAQSVQIRSEFGNISIRVHGQEKFLNGAGGCVLKTMANLS